ncbi:single hybrid motif-containing protein, partial [Pavlovales sp. CCMP2436]
MGDSISEGTVVDIAHPVGSHFGAEEVVASVETDKVTIDVRSTEAGTMSKWHAEVGATVIVGSDFYDMQAGAAPAADAPAPAKPAA